MVALDPVDVVVDDCAADRPSTIPTGSLSLGMNGIDD